MHTNMQMMENHASVLFNHNESGRITTLNEPPYVPAPRLFIGLTSEGNVIRYREDMSQSTISKLEDAIGNDPANRMVQIMNTMNAAQQISRIWFGPSFYVPDIDVKGNTAIQISNSNSGLLKKHFSYLLEELEFKQPLFGVVIGDAVVSACHSARTFQGMVEAGVYTVKEYRRRGFGIQVVSAWARLLRMTGMTALYSTNWGNFASQAVARKLGLVQYGSELHFE